MNAWTAIAGYSLCIGTMMIAMWSMFAVTDQIPELEERPIEIAFHLAAEFVTALTLIIGGAGLTLRREWGFPVNMAGLGMLAYTVVVSPGYYAQAGDYAFVGMFAVMMVLTLIFITLSVIKSGDLALAQSRGNLSK
jgi:peptidoglycan/LPS O-acetylase OafA/YrhL